MTNNGTEIIAETQNLIGMDRSELAGIFIRLGEPPKSSKLRAKQLWHWIYHHGVTDFSKMSTLNVPPIILQLIFYLHVKKKMVLL